MLTARSIDRVPPVTFLDDARLQVGGVTLHYGYPMPEGVDGLVVMKQADMIGPYVALCERLRPAAIVELGINRGGSTALLAELARPERLVAVELSERALPALDDYVEASGLQDVVRLHFGVDQADRARLHAILDADLGDRPLDLVVDDASHQYRPTLASFEVLFPRLRPGGVFVIEDWRAEHWLLDRVADQLAAPDEAQLAALAEVLQSEPPAEPLRTLPRLVHELVMVRTSAPDVIASIELDRYWVSVTRGPVDLADDFRLVDHYHDHFGMLADP
jgi:predicted O-methyltransferase YrrM